MLSSGEVQDALSLASRPSQRKSNLAEIQDALIQTFFQ